MSAQNLSHQQLSMFIPAHEIAKMTLGDRRPGDMSNSVTLARKLAYTKKDWVGSTGIHESIKESGVQEPVKISHRDGYVPTLTDGHHRIASAMDINPKMLIPVENIG